MFKFSDIKIGDILIANNSNGSEYKVLEADKKEDGYRFCVENLETKVKSNIYVQEGTEYKFGLAKIIHA